MNLKPITLQHGERFGKLRVLFQTPEGRYAVGCECGYSGMKVRAKKLMRGEVTECRRCSGIRSGAKRKANVINAVR